MGFLEKMNPEKAKELNQLRTKDQEKFKTELKKLMREQFEKARHGEGGPDGRQRRKGDTTIK